MRCFRTIFSGKNNYNWRSICAEFQAVADVDRRQGKGEMVMKSGRMWRGPRPVTNEVWERFCLVGIVGLAIIGRMERKRCGM